MANAIRDASLDHGNMTMYMHLVLEYSCSKQLRLRTAECSTHSPALIDHQPSLTLLLLPEPEIGS